MIYFYIKVKEYINIMNSTKQHSKHRNPNDKSKMNSFRIGSKRGLKINDENMKKSILKSLESYINTNDRGYKFLDNSMLNYLKINKHLIGLSTFGKKFMLYLTTINDKKYCIYYNKKTNDFISVRHRFKDDIFKNTLIDGELLKDTDTDNWRFSVSDIYAHKGESLNKHNLNERLVLLDDMFQNDFTVDNNFDVATFDIKQYFEYKHLEDLYINYMDTLPYRCSGILFKNVNINEKYLLYIFQENRTKKVIACDKIKQPSQSSVKSFQIKKTDLPDIYELYCSKDGTVYKYGYSGVTTLNNSIFILNLFKDTSKETDIYVKCSYNKLFNKWVPFGVDETIDDYDNIKQIETL